MQLVHSLLWNIWTIGGLILISIYFHFKTEFCVFKRFIGIFKSFLTMDISQFQIIATSLGAVMGIGNIVGVATALISGGPGAIFWMVLSSIVISSLKYVEIFFACLFKKRNAVGYYGGAPVYIKEGIGNSFLSYGYMVLLIISALTMGNMIVSNTLASMIHEVMHIPTFICGIVLVILFGVLISKGRSGVMIVSSHLVPYMIGFYLMVCVGIVCFNLSLFMDSVSLIVKEAFSITSISGGGFGAALKYGVARGIFSNEAGMGSCTMVHAKSDNSAQDEAMLGVFEVFLDSVVMCFFSGVVLVMSGVPTTLDNAMLFLFEGFSVFLGRFGVPFMVVSLVFFGVTSILGWYVFGGECVLFVCRKKWGGFVYGILFLLFVLLGSFSELFVVFSLSDCLNALMIGINLYACVCLVNFLK